MTTIVPGRRPPDDVAVSSISPATRNGNVQQPIQRSLPTSTFRAESERVLEPPSKRRKLSDDGLTVKSHDSPKNLQSPTNDLGASSPPNHLRERMKAVQNHGVSSLHPARPNNKVYYSRSIRSSYPYVRHTTTVFNVSLKSYAPEVPSLAPHYQNSGPADFFAWRGQHPEDILNETTARNGFYDKLPAAQNESSTARPSLWSSMKHKAGLQILSSLFVSTLHQRQAHRKIPTSSTFKPPPRVTLTDTKRESWLKDLSNPSIPLRRLSRTIPHGVRGKGLLDQCLRKGIPISRAIWLAKCVGANEIRASKRKGPSGVSTAGGESKWIKDWTANVEQFLGSILGDHDSSAWTMQCDYGVRLASQLYSEHLMDRGQYLDWIIRSTAENNLERLNAWLLLVKAHLQDFLFRRRRGKHMTEVLLVHMKAARKTMADEKYEPLTQELAKIVQTILATNPTCFILPKCWNNYEALIRDHVIKDQRDLYSAFTDIQQRNVKLQDYSSRAVRHARQSVPQAILQLFDSLSQNPDFSTVAQKCSHLSSDYTTILTCCFEWCSSVERSGAYRPYAAARLIRLWAKKGIDVQGHILGFLASRPKPQGLDKIQIFKVISELVCSGNFSIGRYLQWLMAHGGLHQPHAPGLDDPCYIRLLLELPMHNLPSHVINLRQSLLSKFELTLHDDSEIWEDLKAGISGRLSWLLKTSAIPDRQISDIELKGLSQALKSTAARWIRQCLLTSIHEHNADYSDTEYSQGPVPRSPHSVSKVSPSHFKTILQMFVSLGEYSALADIMISLSKLTQGETLTIILDTANYYHDIFHAIGASKQLFKNATKQVGDERSYDISMQAQLESLIDLGSRLPNVEAEVEHIRKRLIRMQASSITAACSPISDTMAEAVHASDINFLDELEHIFSTGSNIDRQTSARVFRTLTRHLERTSTDAKVSNRIVKLLVRLHILDSMNFKTLMKDWLQGFLATTKGSQLLNVVPGLICSRVLSMADLIDGTFSVQSQLESNSSRVLLTLNILDMMITEDFNPTSNSNYRTYRLSDEQRTILNKHPQSILRLFQLLVQLYSAAKGKLDSGVRLSFSNRPFRALLSSALRQVTDVPDTEWSLEDEGREMIGSYLLDFIDIHEAASSISHRLLVLLDNLNELNMLSSQLRLKAMLCMRFATNNTQPIYILANTLIPRLLEISTDHISLYTRLVSILSSEDASTIRKGVENTILNNVLDRALTTMIERPIEMDGLLALVDTLGFSVMATEPDTCLERIVEILSSHVRAAAQQHLTVEVDPVFRDVPVILHLLVLHQHVFQVSNFPQDTLLRIMLSLGFLLINSRCSHLSAVAGDILDVLYLLSDSLDDDSYSRCTRLMQERSMWRDHRLEYVLGPPITEANDWFKLALHSSFLVETTTSRTILAKNGVVTQPFSHRRWEMVSNVTPLIATNDTSLSLVLFEAKGSII